MMASVTMLAIVQCIMPMADVAVLADALDIQLDLQVDAIDEENAIREWGLSNLLSLSNK
jgi:hypothetical protein